MEQQRQHAVVCPILIGLMGSGKSSIGRRLATVLQRPLIDLDEWIVRQEGRSIPEIFADCGEEGFRDIETEALKQVLPQQAVIATGGGIVMREENRRLLRAHPPVIWLRAAPEFLARRIDGDSNRPLIAQGDTLKKLQELAAVRYPLYAECADYVLPRDDMKKSQALQCILAFLSGWAAQHRG